MSQDGVDWVIDVEATPGPQVGFAFNVDGAVVGRYTEVAPPGWKSGKLYELSMYHAQYDGSVVMETYRNIDDYIWVHQRTGARCVMTHWGPHGSTLMVEV